MSKRIKLTEEHKRRIREAHLGMKKPWSTGEWNKGLKRTEETKNKISNTLKRKEIKPPRPPLEAYCRGKGHRWWKGGLTPINKAIRKSLEYKRWRKAVFERDNYTCVWCGDRNGRGKYIEIHPDHIKPFSLFPELRFAIENGRTLYCDCHKKTNTYGFKTWRI